MFNMPKKNLFLSSSVNEVAHDIVEHMDLKKGKKLAFIYTAAEVETDGRLAPWNDNDRKALVKAGFDVFDYTITDKTKDQVNKDLSDSDAIYLSGGNTFYLLEKAQQSGFPSLIREYIEEKGKVYIGTSAGSIIAGPDISPTLRLDSVKLAPNLKDYKGFDLVNFCVMPHWGADNFKELYLNKRLEHAYKDSQIPLFLLTNTQYAKVDGDDIQIIDVDRL